MRQASRTALLLGIMLLGSCGLARAAEIPSQDPSGAHDIPLLPRFDDARIIAYDEAKDEEAVLPEGRFVDFGFVKVRKLEGRVTRVAYVFGDNGTSTIAVINHYLDVLRGSGFTIEFQCAGAEGCGGFNFGERLTQPMAESHSGDEGNLIIDFLHPVGNDVRYVLATLDRPEGRLTVALAAMRHSGRQTGFFIESVGEPPANKASDTVSATWIQAALRAKGSVPLYAVQFESGNARLRRGWRPVLEQVAHMLLANPLMKLMIVGHTDGSDTMEHGMVLSQARAEAVVSTLIRNWKVPQLQIMAIGVGPAAPLASNADQTGRSLNQRIELVLE